jgi:hypothetical protein
LYAYKYKLMLIFCNNGYIGTRLSRINFSIDSSFFQKILFLVLYRLSISKYRLSGKKSYRTVHTIKRFFRTFVFLSNRRMRSENDTIFFRDVSAGTENVVSKSIVARVKKKKITLKTKTRLNLINQ